MSAYHLIGFAVVALGAFIWTADSAARHDGYRDVWDGLRAKVRHLRREWAMWQEAGR